MSTPEARVYAIKKLAEFHKRILLLSDLKGYQLDFLFNTYNKMLLEIEKEGANDIQSK